MTCSNNMQGHPLTPGLAEPVLSLAMPNLGPIPAMSARPFYALAMAGFSKHGVQKLGLATSWSPCTRPGLSSLCQLLEVIVECSWSPPARIPM